MDYKKYICPVCNEKFNEDDDVVVCPECGTPHHRSCYFQNGKCFNDDKHGLQEDISESFKNKEYEEEKKPAMPLKVTIVDEQTGEDKPLKSLFNNVQVDPVQTFLIEGKPSVYYEIAVKKNQRYYLPRFMAMSEKNAKAAMWNIVPFFVPLAWSMYRKLYKLSAIILAFYMLVVGVTGYYFSQNEDLVNITEACLQEDPNFMEDISLYLSGADNVSLTLNEQKFIEEVGKASVPGGISLAFSICLLAIRFCMGFFANKLYMMKIRKVIAKGESKGLMGDDLKKYVYRKNGTLPIIIVALIGFFEIMNLYR